MWCTCSHAGRRRDSAAAARPDHHAPSSERRRSMPSPSTGCSPPRQSPPSRRSWQSSPPPAPSNKQTRKPELTIVKNFMQRFPPKHGKYRLLISYFIGLGTHLFFAFNPFYTCYTLVHKILVRNTRFHSNSVIRERCIYTSRADTHWLTLCKHTQARDFVDLRLMKIFIL